MLSSNQFLTPWLVFRRQSVFKNRFPEAYFACCDFYAGPASASLLFSLCLRGRAAAVTVSSQNFPSHKRRPHESLVFLTILPREPWIYSVPIYIFFFFFLTFHMTGVTEYITFRVQHLSLSVVLLRPIHALVSISTCLLLIVE